MTDTKRSESGAHSATSALQRTLELASTVLPQMPRKVAWNRVPLVSLLNVYEFLAPGDLAKVQAVANLPTSQIRLPKIVMSQPECNAMGPAMLKSMRLWGHHARTLELANEMGFVWITQPTTTDVAMFPLLESLTLITAAGFDRTVWQKLMQCCPRLVHFICRDLKSQNFTEADWKESGGKRQRPWQTFEVVLDENKDDGDFLSMSSFINVFANPALRVWTVASSNSLAPRNIWTLEQCRLLRKKCTDEGGDRNSLERLLLPFECDPSHADAIIHCFVDDYKSMSQLLFKAPVTLESGKTLQRVFEAWSSQDVLPSLDFHLKHHILPTDFALSARVWPMTLATTFDAFQEWTFADMRRLLLSFSKWRTISVNYKDLSHDEDDDVMDAATLESILQGQQHLEVCSFEFPCELDSRVMDAATRSMGAGGCLRSLDLSMPIEIASETWYPKLTADVLSALFSSPTSRHPSINLLGGVMTALSPQDVIHLAARTSKSVLWEIMVPLEVGRDLQRVHTDLVHVVCNQDKELAIVRKPRRALQ
jgi:hypothetical protein